MMDNQLFHLQRQFFSLTPANELYLPPNLSLTAVNDFLLNDILLNKHFQQYPPSGQYQEHFWKWAIESLEELARHREGLEDEFEISAEIYEHYLQLMPLSGSATSSSTRTQICGAGVLLSQGPPSRSYITHFWSPKGCPMDKTTDADPERYVASTLVESRTTIEGGTTGLRTWLGSFVLAQYLILHPEIIAHKRILELGSGIGFLGIIVASLQQLSLKTTPPVRPGSIWLTDINDEVLERCRYNLNLPCNLSSSHPNLKYMKLDWSESADPEQSTSIATLIRETVKPELVLGADVVFDPSLIPPLVGTLKLVLQHAANDHTDGGALIALTVRNEKTLEQFLANVGEADLQIQGLPLEFEQTSFHQTVESNDSCQNVKLFRITVARP